MNQQQQVKDQTSYIYNILKESLPIYMLKELQLNKLPIKYGNNLTFQRLNTQIQERFPDSKFDSLDQNKLNKIYEGIVEIVKKQQETAMIFKNIVDSEFVKIYFYPSDLREVHILDLLQEKFKIIILFFKN
ncbi:hypothetical protein ABPG74_016615 [Tetrahymena malaccensis]